MERIFFEFRFSEESDSYSLYDGFSRDVFDNFNGDISKWDTARVTTLESAFRSRYADPSFNPDVSKWDTGSVTSFNSMVSATPRRGGAAGSSPSCAPAAHRLAVPRGLEPERIGRAELD